MKTLSWNRRGLEPEDNSCSEKGPKTRKTGDYFSNGTKLDSKEHQSLNKYKLGYGSCFSVDCKKTQRFRRGGLCMLWNEKADLSLVSYSMHHMSFKVKGEEGYGE